MAKFYNKYKQHIFISLCLSIAIIQISKFKKFQEQYIYADSLMTSDLPIN